MNHKAYLKTTDIIENKTQKFQQLGRLGIEPSIFKMIIDITIISNNKLGWNG